MKQIQNSKLETLHSLRSLRVTNLCHPEPSLRHPEPSLCHPESSLRHPERSEGSQETRNPHINIGTGEDIGIKELIDPSKLHALGWKHKVVFENANIPHSYGGSNPVIVEGEVFRIEVQTQQETTQKTTKEEIIEWAI